MQRNQACTQVYVHDLPFAHESKQSNDSLRLMPDPDLSLYFCCAAIGSHRLIALARQRAACTLDAMCSRVVRHRQSVVIAWKRTA
jgi:cell division inhibitor SulA